MKRSIALFLLAACGDNRSTPDAKVADAHVDSMPDAPVPHMGTVTAHAVVHHLTEAGEVTEDMGPATMNLIDSADNVIVPTAVGGGSLQFANVAAGSYIICDIRFVTRSICVQSVGPNINLDSYVVGRVAPTLGTTGTTLTLTVNGASASGGSNEFLDVRIQNTNDYEYPSPPATATPLVLPYSWLNRPLIESGDVIRVVQHTTRTSGSESYVSATRSGSATGVMMTNGVANTASVTLDNMLSQTNSVTFNLRRSQFTTIDGSVGPGFSYTGMDLNGFAEPQPYDDTPWLFYYASTASTDLNMTMTYGNPWPSSNVPTFLTGFGYSRTVTAPGATSGSPIAAFDGAKRLMTALSGDVKPALSRVKALKVNNLDATVAQTGTTVTPTLSWTAPTLGTPSKYTVSVYRVANQSGATVAFVNGRFNTTATSLRIPPGYIHAGEAYVISVRAYKIANYDPLKPFATPTQYEFAESVTEVLQP